VPVQRPGLASLVASLIVYPNAPCGLEMIAGECY
jgi:hypothetical protein